MGTFVQLQPAMQREEATKVVIGSISIEIGATNIKKALLAILSVLGVAIFFNFILSIFLIEFNCFEEVFLPLILHNVGLSSCSRNENTYLFLEQEQK